MVTIRTEDGVVIWDPKAGTVEGTASVVPVLRAMLRPPAPGARGWVIQFWPYEVKLKKDPRHNPKEFKTAFLAAIGNDNDVEYPPELKNLRLGGLWKHREAPPQRITRPPRRVA